MAPAHSSTMMMEQTTNRSSARNRVSSRKRVRFSAENSQSLFDSTAGLSSSTCSSNQDSNSNNNSNNNNNNNSSSRDPNSSSRPVKKRVIEWLPRCADLSDREKRDRWIQPGEWGFMRESINQQTARCHREGLVGPVAETYTQVFALCQQKWNRPESGQQQQQQQQQEKQDDDERLLMPGSLLLPLSSMVVGPFSDVRGLEDRLVPRLGIRRRIDRINIIRTIVKAQHQLQQKRHRHPDEEETVRALSRLLTQPARQMGQVLAAADAASVAMFDSSDSSLIPSNKSFSH